MKTSKKKLIEKLYDYVQSSTDNIKDDKKWGYLTEEIGVDGKEYIWLSDGYVNAAIRLEDGKIIDNEEEIEDLF